MHARIDRWFMADEPNAAGRMGWYRILFAIFYLWHVAGQDLAPFSALPDHLSRSFLLLDILPAMPSAPLLAGIDRALVLALVLLAFGWRVRWTTAAVLVIGVVREAYLTAVGVEDANIFLVFHIPLFMMLAGRWGDTLSVDALARRGPGTKDVARSTSGGEHFLAARSILVLMALLFATSPIYKTLGSGTWLHHPDLVGNLMLQRSVDAVTRGYGGNPIAPWVVRHPAANAALMGMILAFEGTFFLALVNRRLRDLYLAVGLLFHSINALWLMVSFTPILAAYALFFDWERLFGGLVPEDAWPARWSHNLASGVAIGCALAVALTWRSGTSLILTAGGLVNGRSLWIPILPISAVLAIRAVSRTCITPNAAPPWG